MPAIPRMVVLAACPTGLSCKPAPKAGRLLVRFFAIGRAELAAAPLPLDGETEWLLANLAGPVGLRCRGRYFHGLGVPRDRAGSVLIVGLRLVRPIGFPYYNIVFVLQKSQINLSCTMIQASRQIAAMTRAHKVHTE